jgi:regulator of protease activity HflC (stomatin/prohibitin superfamily)
LLPRWETAFILLIATSAAAGALGPSGWRFLPAYWLAALVGPALQIVREWERAIVLRLGKMRKVRGPGLFVLFPLIDTVARKVDLRIRVTDFAAETTLTRDSVPVTVDALCFWLVWDAEKAILEVENYLEAVVLSSQTALRAAISSNDLSTLLADGEKIEEDVRKQVDSKTTEWGITVQHIEITEIIIPEELQRAMSQAAQAEREKKARVLLAEAEKQVAARLQEASGVYRDDPVALRLRNLAVLQEGFRKGNSMVLVPSQLPDELSREDVFGLKALRETRKAARSARKGGRK